MFSSLSAVKFVVSGVVGIGTGKIVGKIIKAHVPVETLIDKITVSAAAWAIGGIATERTKQYTDDMIDKVADLVSDGIEKVKLNEKLARVNRGESTIEKEGIDPTKVRKNPETNKWEKADIVDGETASSQNGTGPIVTEVPANS